MARALCMLGNQGYRHALRICTTYCSPRQQWLHERAWMLRHTCIACLVITEVKSVYCAVRIESLCKTDRFRVRKIKGTLTLREECASAPYC
jgi:hypothetical protein